MKVISGSLKGRIIKGYNIDGTRPTMDRVKESVFGSIQDYIKNSVVLDLFAGSGNLGIEALSNGCKYCYFVDNNKLCIKCIRDNVSNFGISDSCKIMFMDYKQALKYYKDNNISFDIIFVDPPYNYNVINDIIKNVMEYDILNCNGILVLEYQSDVLDIIDGLEIVKCKKYGDKFICILKNRLTN